VGVLGGSSEHLGKPSRESNVVGERQGSGEPAVGAGADEPPAGFVGCEEAIGRLYTYLDGELTEQRRVEIALHLDMCGPCVGAYGFETELRRVVAMRCKDHVPESLIERVALAISQERVADDAPAD
jgi:mycothiol system anti-sigma-R factor